MKRLTLTLLLLLMPAIASCESGYMMMPILEVYDGDTIKTKFSVTRMAPPLNMVSIRVNGVDTPEMPAKSYRETGKLNRAKCVKEAELALKARDAVIEAIEDKRYMKVTNFRWGRNGGRIIGDVKINGIDIKTFLIENGYAVVYHGTGERQDWCK